MESNESYNYEEFKYQYFDFTDDYGLEIGETLENFDVATLEGHKITRNDFIGRPLVLESGSITCPMYVRNIGGMTELVDQYPDVQFAVLYVREAHPGGKIGHHRCIEDKIELAERLKKEDNEKRLILIDDLEGSLHQNLGTHPNWIYILDKDLKVVYKADWAIASKIRLVLDQLGRVEMRLPKPALRIPPPWVFFKVFKRAGLKSAMDFFVRSNIKIPKTYLKLRRKWNRQVKEGIYSS